MTESERRQIIELIKKEVIPAIGCTEPIAVALCVAKAAETLGAKPEKIEVLLSANILKNAMGVGIPGTGMVGLPIAVALGALIGKSDYQLEVLRDCTPEAVEQGKQFIAEKRICISLKEDITEKLYIEVICKTEDKTAKAIIAGGHTTFIYIAKDEQTLLDKQQTVSEEEEEASPELNLRKVYDFALTAPLDEIRFILDTARLNKAAAEQAFKGNYGHSLGKMLRGTYEHKVMGDSVFSHILSYTSAACDARMAGAMIPVMSNSGSGNQGITASIPVIEYAKELGVSDEKRYRALLVSNLITIHLKSGIGRLSAYCGAVSAGCASGAGIAYLYGGGVDEVSHTIVNSLAITSGIICDGAKASCAAKIATAIDAGILGYHMYKEGQQFYGGDGIVSKGVENTIKNVGQLAKEGMATTDQEILKIMTKTQSI